MKQSLQDRIAAIRAEIDTRIDKKVTEAAKASPGIRRASCATSSPTAHRTASAANTQCWKRAR